MDCDIRICAENVADLHALVTKTEAGIVIHGLDAELPVVIPGHKLSLIAREFAPLVHGDDFLVGSYSFRFQAAHGLELPVPLGVERDFEICAEHSSSTKSIAKRPVSEIAEKSRAEPCDESDELSPSPRSVATVKLHVVNTPRRIVRKSRVSSRSPHNVQSNLVSQGTAGDGSGARPTIKKMRHYSHRIRAKNTCAVASSGDREAVGQRRLWYSLNLFETLRKRLWLPFLPKSMSFFR